MARPRTTLDKLPKDWEKLLKDCASEGGSATEARVALGIGRSAWDTLQADSKEFQAAVKEAEALCQSWWERLGRTLSKDGGGNSAVWIFNMKNRFGWRDKPEGQDEDADAQPVKVEVTVKSAKKNADA